jgi:hypothetical protein
VRQGRGHWIGRRWRKLDEAVAGRLDGTGTLENPGKAGSLERRDKAPGLESRDRVGMLES